MKKELITAAAIALIFSVVSARRSVSLDSGWRFAFGNTSPSADFGCGTEYFNYLTKAASIHNRGPYWSGFDDSDWTAVSLPHDFVVDLPFDSLASHSHGYKTVGFNYPSTSVGWYRKTFRTGALAPDERVEIVFDGIFRDSRVWFNGFYLGNHDSGYTRAVYDVTPYINTDSVPDVLVVRSDATLEEGWFYEGGGIYRHARLEVTPALRIARDGVSVTLDGDSVNIVVEIENSGIRALPAPNVSVSMAGRSVEIPVAGRLKPKSSVSVAARMSAEGLARWSPWNPTLQRLDIALRDADRGATIDDMALRTGLREVRFDPDSGMIINGKRLQIKGVNLHQDHAGVGVGIPDGLHLYRLRELKKYGVNAIRTSHNPVSSAMLDIADSLGFIVIEEARLLGVNPDQTTQLAAMVRAHRNHPSVVMWSVGNEEWGVEWNDKGSRIVRELREICRAIDSSRPVTVATSGGPEPIIPADVAGYNYIMQNPVDRYRSEYPERCAYGSEETTGCGTRGVYSPATGVMPALNRSRDVDSTLNRIERGMKFYMTRPWLAGMFYWTGFDYRGEPNPLKYPATGSQFGLLDYCGFPKDEAFYVKSWWTDEPVVHILPHWNHPADEGEPVDVWVYSNAAEVELIVNGLSHGRKPMPRYGHLSWTVAYCPGTVEAIGYDASGRMTVSERISTTGAPAMLVAEEAPVTPGLRIINVKAVDAEGRFVPDANVPVRVTAAAGVRVLGCGNGNPALTVAERPTPGTVAHTMDFSTFNGLMQVIVEGDGEVELTLL